MGGIGGERGIAQEASRYRHNVFFSYPALASAHAASLKASFPQSILIAREHAISLDSNGARRATQNEESYVPASGLIGPQKSHS